MIYAISDVYRVYMSGALYSGFLYRVDHPPEKDIRSEKKKDIYLFIHATVFSKVPTIQE